MAVCRVSSVTTTGIVRQSTKQVPQGRLDSLLQCRWKFTRSYVAVQSRHPMKYSSDNCHFTFYLPEGLVRREEGYTPSMCSCVHFSGARNTPEVTPRCVTPGTCGETTVCARHARVGLLTGVDGSWSMSACLAMCRSPLLPIC